MTLEEAIHDTQKQILRMQGIVDTLIGSVKIMADNQKAILTRLEALERKAK